jgi:hypothetical protein
VGFFYFDTTKLSNGVHTISWVVYDNQGRGDGIGSRYFTVQNVTGENVPEADDPILPTPNVSVTLRRAFDLTRAPEPLTPDETGAYSVEMQDLGRIELQLGATYGNLLVNGERRSLPVGSTLKRGVFYWQPGPGYSGTYDLSFRRFSTDGSVLEERVRIQILQRIRLLN